MGLYPEQGHIPVQELLVQVLPVTLSYHSNNKC